MFSFLSAPHCSVISRPLEDGRVIRQLWMSDNDFRIPTGTVLLKGRAKSCTFSNPPSLSSRPSLPSKNMAALSAKLQLGQGSLLPSFNCNQPDMGESLLKMTCPIVSFHCVAFSFYYGSPVRKSCCLPQ
jgi:hypothetical protein